MLISPETLASNNKVYADVLTTVAASDSLQTPLKNVVGGVATLHDDPVIGCDRATVIPDPNNPGKILLKTWKPTSSADATPIAATTFGKKVSVVVFGQ